MASGSKRSTLPLTRLAARLCGGPTREELVSTRVHLAFQAQPVWDHLMTYEELPSRPPWLLRQLLPTPVRTEGDKNCVGAEVPCIYEQGRLIKRILVVNPPQLLFFCVADQELGIEDCAVAVGGSYQINENPSGSEVILTTKYAAKLHPRWFWFPLERFLLHRLHRHILDGICASLESRQPVREGRYPCKTSPSGSHP